MAKARSSVVFPALVAPAIMMFLRARTAAERNSAISLLMSCTMPWYGSFIPRSLVTVRNPALPRAFPTSSFPSGVSK